MTIKRQGTASSLTGMIGRIVIVEQYGKIDIRRAPQHKVKNSWSPAQVLHRQRFSLVCKFCKLFKNTLIPPIWNYETEKMTVIRFFSRPTCLPVLPANMTPMASLPQSDPSPNDEQLSLLLNFENEKREMVSSYLKLNLVYFLA